MRQQSKERLEAFGISLDQLAMCRECQIKVFAERIGATAEELHFSAEQHLNQVENLDFISRAMLRHQREKREGAKMAGRQNQLQTKFAEMQRIDAIVV